MSISLLENYRKELIYIWDDCISLISFYSLPPPSIPVNCPGCCSRDSGIVSVTAHTKQQHMKCAEKIVFIASSTNHLSTIMFYPNPSSYFVFYLFVSLFIYLFACFMLLFFCGGCLFFVFFFVFFCFFLFCFLPDQFSIIEQKTSLWDLVQHSSFLFLFFLFFFSYFLFFFFFRSELLLHPLPFFFSFFFSIFGISCKPESIKRNKRFIYFVNVILFVFCKELLSLLHHFSFEVSPFFFQWKKKRKRKKKQTKERRKRHVLLFPWLL